MISHFPLDFASEESGSVYVADAVADLHPDLRVCLGSRGRVLLTEAKEIGMTVKTKQASNVAKPRKTKKAELIRLLSTRAGADIETISGKLGWQNHTTRAAISGLRKAGYEVTVDKAEGRKSTRYKITSDRSLADGAAGPATTSEPVNAG